MSIDNLNLDREQRAEICEVLKLLDNLILTENRPASVYNMVRSDLIDAAGYLRRTLAIYELLIKGGEGEAPERVGFISGNEASGTNTLEGSAFIGEPTFSKRKTGAGARRPLIQRNGCSWKRYLKGRTCVPGASGYSGLSENRKRLKTLQTDG